MLKCSLLLFLICVLTTRVYAQVDPEEDIKMLLFTSVQNDGGGASTGNLMDRLEILKNNYELFKVDFSPDLIFHKPDIEDSIRGEYKLKLYKILSYNSEDQHRYLLRFRDFSSEVWLRVGGYVENDIHLLFDYFKEDRIKGKKLRRMLLEWTSSDPMFPELDWECMYKGYRKNSIKSACFRSAYYVFINDSSIGFDTLRKDQLNGVFSRIPLYGRFRRY